MDPVVDIFITTKGTTEERMDVSRRSISSFEKNTPRELYRLWLFDDTGGTSDTSPGDLRYHIAHDLDIDPVYTHVQHGNNMGLGPTINEALALIDSQKRWDGDRAPALTMMLQDDVLYSEGWLERLTKMFLLNERHYRLGFASGIECVEHPVRQELVGGMVLKDWIRATSMLARHEYWMSMWPISRIDPETGRERGKPNDGMGSSVDWWFIRNHENSVCRTGRTNLVIPGLLQHIGYDRSTWLKRDLPESDLDKEKMR